MTAASVIASRRDGWFLSSGAQLRCGELCVCVFDTYPGGVVLF